MHCTSTRRCWMRWLPRSPPNTSTAARTPRASSRQRVARGATGSEHRQALSEEEDGELLAVVEQARRMAPLVHSTIHGEQHWQCVARIGAHLARAPDAAALRFTLLFAVLHDSRRENDNYDPEHGHRAAELVDELACDGRLRVDPGLRLRLRDAIARHNDGETTTDPMIGVC